jgi:hypothetical protein
MTKEITFRLLPPRGAGHDFLLVLLDTGDCVYLCGSDTKKLVGDVTNPVNIKVRVSPVGAINLYFRTMEWTHGQNGGTITLSQRDFFARAGIIEDCSLDILEVTPG